mmetsp:Transcript_16764/g.57386  ORF Transcript_16764/g.57386 Transcript_16764/m.57386 type:complete len:279 (+) Transcript_16764:1320-2156(+)
MRRTGPCGATPPEPRRPSRRSPASSPGLRRRGRRRQASTPQSLASSARPGRRRAPAERAREQTRSRKRQSSGSSRATRRARSRTPQRRRTWPLRCSLRAAHRRRRAPKRPRRFARRIAGRARPSSSRWFCWRSTGWIVYWTSFPSTTFRSTPLRPLLPPAQRCRAAFRGASRHSYPASTRSWCTAMGKGVWASLMKLLVSTLKHQQPLPISTISHLRPLAFPPLARSTRDAHRRWPGASRGAANSRAIYIRRNASTAPRSPKPRRRWTAPSSATASAA